MDFINKKRMPVEVPEHVFEEVTYKVDGINVRGLLMTPQKSVERIVIYLRGGKGQVGKVRAARLMQFSDPNTLVFGPYYSCLLYTSPSPRDS